MGITTDKYFENLYSVIFSPKAFFEREDLTISIRLAVTTVILITVLSKIATSIFDGSIANMWFAVFADTGVTVLTILNTIRIMKKRY